MKNVCLFLCLLLSAVFLFSCASAQDARTPPEWVIRGTAAVYPPEAFIVQEGRGKNRTAAETDALAALSRYFITEVATSTSSSFSAIRGGAHSARVDMDTFVHSATQLFAVRYAAPWREPDRREYRSAAYINREEAWAIFESRVKKEADTFRALYEKAESEVEPLRMFFDYRAAQLYTNREAFTSTMAFGEALHPAKMGAAVRDVREMIPLLNARIGEARVMAGIFIECPRDFESGLFSTLTRLLSSEGFFIANALSMVSAICMVTVDEGYQEGSEGGHFYYPSVNVVITAQSGETLFSWSASPGKQAAISAEAAKRRAYAALAGELQKNFLTAFYKNFE